MEVLNNDRRVSVKTELSKTLKPHSIADAWDFFNEICIISTFMKYATAGVTEKCSTQKDHPNQFSKEFCQRMVEEASTTKAALLRLYNFRRE